MEEKEKERGDGKGVKKCLLGGYFFELTNWVGSVKFKFVSKFPRKLRLTIVIFAPSTSKRFPIHFLRILNTYSNLVNLRSC
jgi:hypothetical protein